MRRVLVFASMAWVLGFSQRSHALTISSGPCFTPATNAPLAGLLKVGTDVPARISVLVSDGADLWERDFFDFSTSNSIPLFGFKPGRTNLIQVTAYDEYRNACTAAQLLTFVTSNLPPDFPKSTVLTNYPSQMEPGYTLFIVHNRNTGSAYITMMDYSGQVVWYRRTLQTADVDVRQLANGHLFFQQQPPADRFVEMDLLGNIVQTWTPPAAYPVNSHEGFITSHGTILYLSDVQAVVSNFPSVLPKNTLTDSNPPLVTVTVDDNPVVEISATNGALLNVWSSLNLLDPDRVTYLTGDLPSAYFGALDTEHANAIFEDTNDNSIIVSQRDENTVYKFSRATGQLVWILAPHASWPTNLQPHLLTPVGGPLEWCYGQHAPKVTPQGTLIVFDNGEWRASPFDPKVPDSQNYSRAVEYSIDETNMTISQIWDSYDAGQGGGDQLYSAIMGNVEWLPQNRNILTTYAWVSYTNGLPLTGGLGPTMARIVEYTHDPVPQVVFDLAFWDYTNTSPSYAGYYVYRSNRISDLYVHPVLPVAGFWINFENQTPRLEFSADPSHNYMIQASGDLINWTTIGPAIEGDGVGEFDFDDLDAGQFDTRFYRVVTQ